MRALYVSHNGMLEGLGQSQVLPYLRGLAKRGIEFDLVSFELPDADEDAIEDLRASLSASGIRWSPLRRRRDTRLRVKVLESSHGVVRAFATAAARRPTIVHGRGYLPTAIADVIATTIPGAKLLFDCRGMLADEYVDAGHWTTARPEYRLVKRFERRAFHRAEGVVVLTEALRRWLTEQAWLGPKTTIETIPTCVDLDRFRFDADARNTLRAELGVEDRTVIVYSGSLSALYRVPDMARFVGVVKRRASRKVAFLVLTPSPADELVKLAAEHGLDEDEIVVRRAKAAEMPGYLSAADLGLAFGTTCFARMGCSPTKLAEYLACGVPVVGNSDFGDQGALAGETSCCVLVPSFDDDVLVAAADRILSIAHLPLSERVARGRRVADARFGLEAIGIERYERLYRTLTRSA
jgi:glycosyltransferase involved in cell wall biosynthesis